MNAIVAVDRNWAIGRNGKLLVHLPGDLKYYKEKTTGNVIIVGRKTLESFPGGRPLPNRVNVVLTTDRSYDVEGCIICHSKEEALAAVAEYDAEDVFIAGGAEIYRQFMDDCEEFYVTKIDGEFEADTYFPDLDAAGFRVIWESEPHQENGISYRFMRYGR